MEDLRSVEWSLDMYQKEVENKPKFESGSITIHLIENYLTGERSIDGESWVNLQTTFTRVSAKTIFQYLQPLCSSEFSESVVTTALSSLEIHPNCFQSLKTNIASYAAQLANETKNLGLRHFSVRADVVIQRIYEVVTEREELDLAVTQSMGLLRLKQVGASKSSIEKLTRGTFDGTVDFCTVCLDEFSVGSEVISMPCSHIYHSDCLLRWLEENNSCPVCRYKLPA